MGYTHTFNQTCSFTDEEWCKVMKFCKQVFKMRKGILGNGFGEVNSKPTVNGSNICFNGIGDDSHETFQITKSRYEGYNFTKTARKPYDEVVVAILTYINFIAPHVLEISSDGSDEPNMFIDGTSLVHIITKDLTIPWLFHHEAPL